jgi:hypothetical protein
MVDAPQGFHAGAVQQEDGAVSVQGQQGNNNHPNNNALPIGFQDWPLQDQMMVHYSQNAILGCKFSELRASVENNAATNLQNYNVLNWNINRMAMAPARPVTAGQNAAPAGRNAAPLGSAGNNNPGPANIAVGGGTLLPLPRTLYDLWVEYQTGIGGRKAARDLQPDKYRYYRRKHVWDIVANLVNPGVQAKVAVDRIYSHYGANKPVTRIIKDIMLDKRNGGLPLVLRV